MTRALSLVALWILPLPAEEIRFDSAVLELLIEGDALQQSIRRVVSVVY